MTAEIAIINRSAVTLATDSAVTLTVRGAEKIYNSADKLFELSDIDPMGIMVYNNLEFMGISLEVAIKQFRKKGIHFKGVIEAADAFFKYLLEDLAPDESLQRQHANAILFPAYVSLRGQFEHGVSREFEEKGGNLRKIDLHALLSQTTERSISEVKGREVAECFAEISEQDLAVFYSESIGDLIRDVFEDIPLDQEQRAQLVQLGILLLHRDVPSEAFTGLVFAGFGENETFPSLVAFKTDGVILGKVKRKETDRETTSRSEVTGRILPFAQREMVDRFLYGIDPEFEEAIERYLIAAIGKTGETIAEALPKRKTKELREKLRKSIASATSAAVTNWRDKMVPLHKGRFIREVQNMIFLMPKQELAALAQELINLTSVKRKFSSGRESVGGPIDVAVISKIDGFVWVRRKHYFEPNLNPRYFHRKFGSKFEEKHP